MAVGSIPTSVTGEKGITILITKKKLACPSGLRGHVKAVICSHAWVQTPQSTILYKIDLFKILYNNNNSDVAQRLACLAHNQKVGGSIPLVAIYGSSQQFLITHY